MSVTKSRPHVLVLPEDKANLELANGFHLRVPLDRQRQMQVLKAAGGWNEVLDLFRSVHVTEMGRWEHRLVVLLIDFDGRKHRLTDAKGRIPEGLADRVFVVGTWTQPEDLKAAFDSSYEKIGQGMAEDCRDETDKTWGHELLRHNASELDRLREHVRPILFPPNRKARTFLRTDGPILPRNDTFASPTVPAV